MSAVPAADFFVLSRADAVKLRVEEFLIAEAALLDAWQLDDWVELFTDDATYIVPATDHDPAAPDGTELVLIYDERSRIAARAARLSHPNAHAEVPRPRTRRLISCVRVRSLDESDGSIRVGVSSNFAIFSARHRRLDTFVGTYHHDLVVSEGGFRIAARRAVLDLEDLVTSAHAVNIIL